jgi:hypothetical protein
MKKVKTIFATLFVAGAMFTAQFANAACTITPQDSSGLDPNWTDLPCITQGQAYNEVINLKNFGSVSGITVEWLRVDSITGAPAGINWAMTVPTGNPANQLFTEEDGCIEVSGTSSAARGNYQLGLYVCVKVTLSPSPLCDEANSLIQTIGSLSPGASLPDFSYFLRVVENGEACPDSLVDADVSVRELQSVSGLSVYPNPFSSKTVVSFNSVETAKYTARLIDVMGKEVYAETLNVTSGSNKVELNRSNLSTGVYFFTLSDGKATTTKRLIVE